MVKMLRMSVFLLLITNWLTEIGGNYKAPKLLDLADTMRKRQTKQKILTLYLMIFLKSKKKVSIRMYKIISKNE